MLRRSGDAPKATALLMTGLSFLRTPTVAEQALPFAVLFGSMIAFLNLSRKLELVVARAAGVSVWQILTPPLIVIAVIGVLSVVVYNPASAWMKQRADEVENRVFGGRDCPGGDYGFGRRALTVRRSSTRAERTLEARALAASRSSISTTGATSSSEWTRLGRIDTTVTGSSTTPRSSRPASRPCPSRPICSRPTSIAARSLRRSWRRRPCRFGNCRARRPDCNGRAWIRPPIA